MALQQRIRTAVPVGPYSVLLATLLILLIGGAALADTAHEAVAHNLLLGAALLAGIYSVRGRRNFKLIAGALAIATYTGLWIAELGGPPTAQIVALGAGSGVFFYAALVILASILTRPKISADELAGAVSVYLLIGLSGGFIFALIDLLNPASVVSTSAAFRLDGAERGLHAINAYIYFSFTCLTTLGFGDLIPASPLARVLSYLAAVIGQLYLAVLVARVVGLHLSHASTRQD